MQLLVLSEYHTDTRLLRVPLLIENRRGDNARYVAGLSDVRNVFLPLDEAIVSIAVFVIVSGKRAETLLEPAK